MILMSCQRTIYKRISDRVNIYSSHDIKNIPRIIIIKCDVFLCLLTLFLFMKLLWFVLAERKKNISAVIERYLFLNNFLRVFMKKISFNAEFM